QSLTILKILIFVFAVLIVASLAEPAVSADNDFEMCVLVTIAMIVPSILFANSSKQSKFTLSTNLDIPPPVLEENKEEYLAELDKIRAAEEWIENNKVTEQPVKPVIKNNTNTRELTVPQDLSNSNTFLRLILLFMLYLFGLIIFVPQEEFSEAFFGTLFFFLVIFLDHLLFRSNSARKVKEVRDIKPRSTTYWSSFVLFWVMVGLILVGFIFYLIGLFLEGLWN
ncbi:MAG: hypothetical protein VXW28_01370, partial [Candidatus Thermoplasmatota archaeon]|nr:hypothetical protein [Candidatus Thermoplasmatota archaeon]